MTGGRVLLVSSTERVDRVLVRSHEVFNSVRVILDQRLESLSRVSHERLDLLGVCGLHFFHELGELLLGSLDGTSVVIHEILDVLVDLHALNCLVVEILENVTGGRVLLGSSTESLDLVSVLSKELASSFRVLPEELLESLSRVSHEGLDQSG